MLYQYNYIVASCCFIQPEFTGIGSNVPKIDKSELYKILSQTSPLDITAGPGVPYPTFFIKTMPYG